MSCGTAKSLSTTMAIIIVQRHLHKGIKSSRDGSQNHDLKPHFFCAHNIWVRLWSCSPYLYAFLNLFPHRDSYGCLFSMLAGANENWNSTICPKPRKFSFRWILLYSSISHNGFATKSATSLLLKVSACKMLTVWHVTELVTFFRHGLLWLFA